MKDQIEIQELMLMDDTIMFTGKYVIHCISHSKPQTVVTLTVDGHTEHVGSKASIESYRVPDEEMDLLFTNGLIVDGWFKVESPDAHTRIVYEVLKNE